MNVKLDKRLGRIWDEVRRCLGMEETDRFLDLVVKAKDFDDLPEAYKNLVLEIESSSKEEVV